VSYAYIAILVIAVVVAVALSPKPPNARPGSLTDIDVPTAEEGRPIPVVFGRVTVTSPNVVWYGDLFYAAVTTRGGK